MEKKQTTVVEHKDIVTDVAKSVRNYVAKGELMLPPNYSPENALKSAWLILQETTNKENRSVLQACSQASIVNCLLDLVVQGLNPSKNQCYFIAYGNKLTCFRSYFGSMAVVKNIAGAKDVYSEIIYDGDEFAYKIENGRKKVINHTQKFANINPDKITGAYCTIVFEEGEYTEIMSYEEIKTSWEKSRVDPEREGGVHSMFPGEMCKRTVINRACKKYINSSNDSAIFLESFNRADETLVKEDIAEEIEEKANKQVIDIEPSPPVKDEGKEPEEKLKEKPKEEPKEKEQLKEEPKIEKPKEKTYKGSGQGDMFREESIDPRGPDF